jgi:hypothetical protein
MCLNRPPGFIFYADKNNFKFLPKSEDSAVSLMHVSKWGEPLKNSSARPGLPPAKIFVTVSPIEVLNDGVTPD